MKCTYLALRMPLVVLLVTATATTQVAEAAMLPTERIADAVSAAGAHRNGAVLSLLFRQDLREAMRASGVSEEEAAARVAALTDAEAQRLLLTIESAPAGASAAAVLFIILFFLGIWSFRRDAGDPHCPPSASSC